MSLRLSIGLTSPHASDKSGRKAAPVPRYSFHAVRNFVHLPARVRDRCARRGDGCTGLPYLSTYLPTL